MRFSEFKRTGDEASSRYVAPVRDATGAKSCQLILTGARDIIEAAFKKADITINIDPKASQEQWEETLRPFWEEERQGLEELTNLERVDDLMKPYLPDFTTPEPAVFLSLHRLQGKGTLYFITIPPIFWPVGFNFIVLLPPVCSCFAVVAPISGDPDLALSFNGPFNPGGIVSAGPGSTVERIFFTGSCLPFSHFVPFFRVRPFILAPPGSVFSMIYGGWGIW